MKTTQEENLLTRLESEIPDRKKRRHEKWFRWSEGYFYFDYRLTVIITRGPVSRQHRVSFYNIYFFYNARPYREHAYFTAPYLYVAKQFVEWYLTGTVRYYINKDSKIGFCKHGIWGE
jgi:hypothetical protein